MGTTWKTVSEYVDIDTGELIRKTEIENDNYKIIKTVKKTIHEIGRATNYRTNFCRRNKYRQGELHFSI